MKIFKAYIFEYLLVIVVALLSVAGFWNIYFGIDAKPTPYQTLHVVTSSIWLLLLVLQLGLIGKKRYLSHKKVGLSILFFGPMLVATTALLSVHSAHKGFVSGRGDPLIVQNVMVTLELGFMILMAFIMKQKRALHGAFILGTAILFMGIALFFTLLGFVPQFKIEGPETFYRFGTAAATGQVVCLIVGILFFLKDRRNGWPFLIAGSFLTLNLLINIALENFGLISGLTEFVASFSELITFLIGFVLLLTLLISTGVLRDRRGNL